MIHSEITSMRRGATVAAMALFAAMTAPAMAAEQSAELKEVVRLAKQEGRVQVVGTQFGAADGVKIAEAGIKKLFDADIRIEFAPGAAMAVVAAKLAEEHQARQKASSDLFAATAIQLGPYQDKGLYRKIDWVKLMPERIAPAIVEADGQALRVETQTPGIMYNVRTAPWVKDIKVMADLLKSEHKGKFFTTPYLAGFDVLLARNAWGPDKTIDYLKKLSPQLSGFMNCASDGRIASGEVPALVFDCTGGAQHTPKYKNLLDLHIISDAAQIRPIYLTVPTHAAQPNAAILYALYLLSADGQRDVVLNMDGADLDHFPESAMGRKIKALEAQGVKFTTVDFDWFQKNAMDLQAPMRQAVEVIRQGR